MLLAESFLPTALKVDLFFYYFQHQDAVGVALSTEFAAQLREKYDISEERAAQLAAIGAAAVGSIRPGKTPVFRTNVEARTAAEAMGYIKINETVHGGAGSI